MLINVCVREDVSRRRRIKRLRPTTICDHRIPEVTMQLFVTGGAGFIGSNFIRHTLGKNPDYSIVNFHKLTYAGNLDNLRDVADSAGYSFVRGDICDRRAVDESIAGTDVVINFAAESHVDRSIEKASDFIETNDVRFGCEVDHNI